MSACWSQFGQIGFELGRAVRAEDQIEIGDPVLEAEGLAAPVAMELRASGAEHGAASGAGLDRQADVRAVLVGFDRQALEQRIAGGAGGGVELLSHKNIMP